MKKQEVLAYVKRLPCSTKDLSSSITSQHRVEIAVRTALGTGAGLARITVEDGDGAMDRCKRLLRLKHLEQAAMVWQEAGK